MSAVAFGERLFFAVVEAQDAAMRGDWDKVAEFRVIRIDER